MNPIYIHRSNGTYLGFILDGFLFSRDGEYLGWVTNGVIWDRTGQFRGQIFNEKYIVRNRFAVPPVPRVAPPMPAKPPSQPQQQLIPAITLPFGLEDAF